VAEERENLLSESKQLVMDGQKRFVEWEKILNEREAALSEREKILSRREALVPETVEVKEDLCPKCGEAIPTGSGSCPACLVAEAEANRAVEEAARRAVDERARRAAVEEARMAEEAAKAQAVVESAPAFAPEPAKTVTAQPSISPVVEARPEPVESPRVEEPQQRPVQVEKFCPNCRTIVDASSEKCYACGADLGVVVGEVKEGAAPSEEKPSEEDQKGPEVKRAVSIRRIIRRK